MGDLESTIVQWLVDTRKLWAVSDTSTPKARMHEFKQAEDALALLPRDEQQTVLKHYHVRDAKMSLASQLLKRLVISKYCEVPWSESVVSTDSNRKPCYRPKAVGGLNLDFNVSHQAGIVTVVASPGFAADIGTDVVCVNERNDLGVIEKEGLFSWLDLHADVFARSEVQTMKFDASHLDLPLDFELSEYGRDAISRCQILGQTISLRDAAGNSQDLDSEIVINAKLRRFYAFWCLREAYVKMTGEALLADWLRELEFRNVTVPRAINSAPSDNSSLPPGEVVTEFEIFLKGKRVSDTTMELVALGSDYMVASAVRPKQSRSHAPLSGFTEIDLEKEIASIVQGAAKSET